MLISKKYKFIFIHVYKNAGTSISHALMPFAGNRLQQKVNQLTTKLGFLYPFGPTPYPGHIKASELVSLMGRDKFDSYFSFAIVRNPWDWQVSLYNFMLGDKNHFQHKLACSFQGFEEYLEWRCANEVRFQRDFVFSKDNEQLVDFVGKYENLDSDFQKICLRIGIEATLLKLNVSNAVPYQEFYDKKTIELVSKTFATDIETFGYEFF